MKKLLFLLPLLLLLSSCGKPVPDSAKTLYGSTDRFAAAGEVLWHCDLEARNLRWLDPVSGRTGSAHSDPLCGHEWEDDCPFAFLFLYSLAADGNILWFSGQKMGMDQDSAAVFRWDMEAQKLTKIADLCEGASVFLDKWCVSGGFLWYAYTVTEEITASGQAVRYEIRKIPLSGGEPETAADMGEDSMFRFWVEGGSLYTSHFGERDICRDGAFFADPGGGTLAVADGWLWCCRNIHIMEREPDDPDTSPTGFIECELWRVPLDDPGSEGELVLTPAVSAAPFFGEDGQVYIEPYAGRLLFRGKGLWPGSGRDQTTYVYGGTDRILAFDPGSGETKEFLRFGADFLCYGLYGLGEGWAVVSGFTLPDPERIDGDLRVNDPDFIMDYGYYRVDPATGERERLDFGF